MIDIMAIEREAADCRRAIGLEPNDDAPATEVWKAVTAHLGLGVETFGPRGARGPDVLGTLCAENRQIHVARRLGPEERAFVVAHEVGHFRLHPGIGIHFDQTRIEGRRSPHGTFQAVGYSERERLELDADAFALELLCPAAWLRDQILHRRHRPDEIASRIGLPRTLVRDHAIAATLLRRPVAHRRRSCVAPMWVEREAIVRHDSSHLVAEVGPSAGATTMAVARVAWLLGSGVKSSEILVLAPSEGMLATLRDAMATRLGREDGLVWTGTHASLGFEFVAKHAASLDRPSDFRLLDETGAFSRFDALRRRMAPRLPARAAFVAAFTAKERLIDPLAWATAAERDRSAARTAADRERADKAHDVGRVYAAYERLLEDEGAVDAADLLGMPARLLRRSSDLIPETARRFRHAVVDGLHDFGPAALELMRLMANDGMTIWAVGDPGRCIMRHDGASPKGMKRFARAIEARWASVGLHHAPVGKDVADDRSVRVGIRWSSIMGPRPTTIAVSDRTTLADEAGAIAEELHRHEMRGVTIRDQMVLARTHRVAKTIAAELETLGIRTTSIPDLKANVVAMDLLAVAALISQGSSSAFTRVARFPEYGLPETEIQRWAARNGANFTSSSLTGNSGWQRLAQDLSGLDRASSAANALKTWLFERSDYLWRISGETDPDRREVALATIHHVLRIAEEHEAQGDADHGRLVSRVNRAGGLRQRTSFARAWATLGKDALSVMTIHAARGHTRRVIHLAGVRDGLLPVRPRPLETLWPKDLSGPSTPTTSEDDQDASLIQVAASLATEHLHVSGTGAASSVRHPSRRHGARSRAQDFKTTSKAGTDFR